MNDERLKRIIRTEVRNALLKEDLSRGIPDFALSQAANAAVEDLKQHLKNHIIQTSGDPVQQRQKFAAANAVLKELETDLVKCMEEKLLKFMRMT